MTSHGPPPLQGRNTLFLQLCFKYHGPKFLLHPGRGVRSVIAGQIPFFSHLYIYAGNSPKAEMKGGLPRNYFQEKMGWDCYQCLCSEIIEIK